MKQIPPVHSSPAAARRKRGIALITVVSVLALMTLLTVAMFSMSQTELASSNQQSYQGRSRELADSAVSVVMDQIWQGTKRKDGENGTDRFLWASQPGAVRRYRMDGAFDAGFKLYSSSQMVVRTSERGMVTDVPPVNWNTMPSRYVDLNEPVIRPAGSLTSSANLFFPILDPRAYVRGQDGVPGNGNVEGFYYSAGVNGVVDPPTSGSAENLEARLPMPVEWLYVLKDGTFGVLNGDNEFVKPDGNLLTPAEGRLNPISGRVAFWTDDESCKLNINTASEPTPWAVPSLFHDRDLWWAHYQPTTNEHQRFPGHPATVALSTVLFPNQEMSTYGMSGTNAAYAGILQRRETIYKITPKINFGGSKGGTVAYWKFVDNYTGAGGSYKDALYNKYLSLVDSIQERLYASVDELYFADGFENGRRKLTSYVNGADGSPTNNSIFTVPGEPEGSGKINLERLRFFLTAQSRMPETNLYGLPRVAAWPVADEGGLEYEAGRPIQGVSDPSEFRTGFDQLIAFCSSLGQSDASGANSYFFRRKTAYSPTRDIQLQRNQLLIKYLFTLMEQTYPGGASFRTKYPQDYKQIIVQIFDYIRATNLYDGFLAPTKESLQSATGPYASEKFAVSSTVLKEPLNDGFFYAERPKNFKTFTYDRSSVAAGRGAAGQVYTERVVERSMPGHGTVVPSRMTDGANTYGGFGRFVALSEVGFQFICTADGTPDKGSYVTPLERGGSWIEPVEGDPDRKVSGGRTAVRIIRHTPEKAAKLNEPEFGKAVPMPRSDPFVGGKKIAFWYSNFPPRPTKQIMENYYGVDPQAAANKANSPYQHPGSRPENWNSTLDSGAPPLDPGQRRVQGMLVMKFSMPSPGFTLMNPEFCVKVEGLKNMQLAGADLYDRTGASEFEWKSNNEFFGAEYCRPFGGSASAHAMMYNRRVGSRTIGVMADTKYVTAGGSRASGTAPAPHFGTRNLDLTTKFLTVQATDNSGTELPMAFTGGRLTVKIYGSHRAAPEDLVQEVTVDIPSTTLPVPQLVTVSSDYKEFMSGGTIYKQEAIHAPRWWAFNYCGALRRFAGSWNGSNWGGVSARPDNYVTDFATNGRLFLPTSASYPVPGIPAATYSPVGLDGMPRWASVLWGYDPNSSYFNSPLINPSSPAADSSSDAFSDTQLSDTRPQASSVRDPRGQDTLFTMIPAHGDVRLLAAKGVVPPEDWVLHPRTALLGQTGPGPGGSGSYKQYVAHSLSRFYSDREAGYDRGVAPARLVPGGGYPADKVPDLPQVTGVPELAARYGDFDNGISDLRDGAYINKPDEGNTHISFRVTIDSQSTIRIPLAYMSTWAYGDLSASSGESFMSPNRMIPSPGMFGSLPTNVHSGDPWRTLLFRPNAVVNEGGASGPKKHPGAASWQGGVSPADHLVMDLFWMPVVEPYALSEPFSTAGKVNINYQIVPFRYIRRATGIHALLKGEVLKAVPTADAPNYLNTPSPSQFITHQDGYTYKQPWTDIAGNLSDTGQGNMKYWHRDVEAEKRNSAGKIVGGVLQQFEDRFDQLPSVPAGARGLFRTASQICEIHLIPKKLNGDSGAVTVTGGDGTVDENTPAHSVAEMQDFWMERRLTGDNTRERPYANLYGKITTQSNTFRVHYRVQAIRKARSSAPEVFEMDKDNVLTDFRGSSLIERRIDPADSRIPDYAASATPLDLPSLEEFYRFRVLEVKRFMP